MGGDELFTRTPSPGKDGGKPRASAGAGDSENEDEEEEERAGPKGPEDDLIEEEIQDFEDDDD